MIKFEERQLVGDIWKVIWILFLIVFTMLYIFRGEVYIIGIVICVVFTILSLMLRLDVSVYDDKIEYRLFPFHISNKVILFDDIENIDVTTFNQKGVYGFKIKSNWNGSIYFMGGKNVIRIVNKNKKIIMLGTKKMKEIKSVLDAKK